MKKSDSATIVKQALSFEAPDRLPVFESFWAEWEQIWRRERGIPSDVSASDHFGNDISICVGQESLFSTQAGEVKQQDGYVYRNDGWGRVIRTRPGTYFSETVERVLEAPGDLDAIVFDSPALDSRYTSLGHQVSAARTKGQAPFVKIGGVFIRTSFFRGEAEFLMDLAADEVFARELAERVGDHLLQIGLESLRRGDVCDTGVWVCDDMCNALSPMFSPRMFERIFLPIYERMVATLKAAGARLVVLHCDGNLGPLLPMVVDAGFDGINPVERSAGLIIEDLIEEYFGRLFLIGGVCNIQILPRGGQEAVRRHIEAIVDAGRNGGLIVGSHSLGPDIPVEAIELYRKIVSERGAYRSAG
ncbi:MAG: hypothetical protein HON70_18715 [Lentisphaerae bacterium]|nr:hypothetical protein [Lentisphaerota bacterium]